MTDAPMPRRATAEDVPAMATVVNAWVDATEWFPRDHAPEVIEGFIRDALPYREIWVIGAPVAGYLSFDPESGRIGGLYCLRQGEGLGKALMDAVKAGRTHLWLQTHVPNLRAQAFYRREGFVQVGGEITPEPPDTVPELRMEWRA